MKVDASPAKWRLWEQQLQTIESESCKQQQKWEMWYISVKEWVGGWVKGFRWRIHLYLCLFERMRGGRVKSDLLKEWGGEGGRVKSDPAADGRWGPPQKLLDGMAECQNESTFPLSSTEKQYRKNLSSYLKQIQRRKCFAFLLIEFTAHLDAVG